MEFLRDNLGITTVNDLEDLLTIRAAGGSVIPYLGYVNVEMSLTPSSKTLSVCALVVEQDAYSTEVPIVLGTNVLKKILNDDSVSNLDAAWKMVSKTMQTIDDPSGILGYVKSTAAEIIPPGQKKLISGLTRACAGVQSPKLTVLTEAVPDHALPGGVIVTPSLLHVQGKSASSYRMRVEVQNVTSRPIAIPARSYICALHSVSIASEEDDPSSTEESVSDTTFLQMFDWPDDPVAANGLKEVILKWKDVFSLHSMDYGRTDRVKHDVKLTDERPIKMRHRRVPPSMVKEVKDHLQEMLANRHIRPSSSPWAFPAVLARKKDNSLRFCVDYRDLNAKTIRDAYALPRIDETMDALKGATLFSSLDLRGGYWQVDLEEDAKQKTAFTVGNLGFYEFNVMPFGLTNSPATFQRLMEMCLAELQYNDCLVYLDDIIIFSSTLEEHLCRLEKVFSRLRDYKLKLKPSKCHFLQDKIKYLGHIVSQDGVAVDPAKISAVEDWPVPTTLKELQKFLGFAGFYRRFVEGFSKLAAPLTRLLKGHSNKNKQKSSTFVWTEEQQSSFDCIKRALTSTPVLGFADYTLPFIVHVDASSQGLGAVLYQRQEGKLKVLSYASRGLKASEALYPAYKLEFLALKWAITDKFHDYLYGHHCEVYTDSNPLTYVLTSARLDATGHRWLARLSAYDFSLHYKAGKTNIDADGLSRIPREVNQNVVQAVCSMKPVNSGYVSTLPVTLDCGNDVYPPNVEVISSMDVQQAQQDDADLSVVLKLVKTGSCPPKEKWNSYSSEVVKYLRLWDKLLVDDQLLHYSPSENVKQLVVPVLLRSKVLSSLHDSMAHPGRDKTLSLAKDRFYWPGLHSDVERKVSQCRRCLCRKSPGQNASIVPILTSHPLELVCCDFLLEEPSQGYEHLLVITDHFTKFARVIPTRNKTVRTTAKFRP